MLLVSILCYLLILTLPIDGYFYLYDTFDGNTENYFGYYDCIYSHSKLRENTNMKMNNINNIYSAVPYYIRSLTRLISQQQLCYGNEIRFSDLKLLNITIQNLYVWHSPIEILNNYGKYLVAPDGSSVNDEQIYCNCSNNSWFGLHCQYTFDSTSTFSTVIRTRFNMKYILHERLLPYMNEENIVTRHYRERHYRERRYRERHYRERHYREYKKRHYREYRKRHYSERRYREDSFIGKEE
ncbi:unnamed protein product [Didymodactylos carnosus]|uniref:EGF-like domain-containing protein n=1 Tax=Didymodactylos carnosus TaxID=1234261 RepID=A0A8S2EBP4_9BILA|nr:unnamed protein product [Didymodactylos carnosus]CAF3892152.1 unnamed protein product [Didymodactylos carnosus]